MRHRLLFIVLFLGIGVSVFSQTYFNRHIFVGTSNLTSGNILSYGDNVLCSYLNFDTLEMPQSGFVIYNPEDEALSNYEFPNQRIGLDGVYINNNELLLFGKQFGSFNGLNFLRFDLDNLTIIEEKTYSTFLNRSFPFGGERVGNSFYQGYDDEYDDIDHRQTGIIKLDQLGNKIWQRNYNSHITRNPVGDVSALSDGRIVVSIGTWRASEQERIPEFLLLDPADGAVLDSVYAETFALQFDSKVYSEVLNNDILVQAYKTETVLGEPVRLDFYNADLDLLNTVWIQSIEPLRISPLKIIKGQGDYFFLVGYYTDEWESLQYGYVSKISNSGTVLWRHHYRHPDFLGDNVFYTIQDLIEDENGDLTCMGGVFPIVSQKELWLFKVNEHGCFGGVECEEEVITSTREINEIPTDIVVYPNPVKDKLYVESEDISMATLTIFDMRGRLVSSHTVSLGPVTINVNGLASGTYALKITDRSGKSYGRVFVKE